MNKQEKITQCEGLIKKLSYEIKLMKKLGEIKNLRHSGLWKEGRGTFGIDMPDIDEVSMNQENSFIQAVDTKLDKNVKRDMGSAINFDFDNDGDFNPETNGIYGDNQQQFINTEDSAVYDWIVDIDMISKVEYSIIYMSFFFIFSISFFFVFY